MCKVDRHRSFGRIVKDALLAPGLAAAGVEEQALAGPPAPAALEVGPSATVAAPLGGPAVPAASDPLAGEDETPCAAASCGGHHAIGGQAVLEGVMMRAPGSWSLAVRRPSGGIACHSFGLATLGQRYPLFKLPVVRGIGALWESLSLGIKALGLSANLCMTGVEELQPGEDPVEGVPPEHLDRHMGRRAHKEATRRGKEVQSNSLGWKEMTFSILMAVLLASLLFVVLPLAVAKGFDEQLSNPFLFNLVEGLIRIGVFVAYIVVISRLPDLRRVFEYHGAEHKVIHAYEAGEDLETIQAGRYSTLHPRCGTAFLLVVMVMAVLVFSVVGKPSFMLLVLSRLIGIPLIAGLSYEVIKYAGRHKDGAVSRVISYPGLMLQRLTTREPSEDQVQVAVSALVEVLRVEAGGQPVPCSLQNAGAPSGAPA